MKGIYAKGISQNLSIYPFDIQFVTYFKVRVFVIYILCLGFFVFCLHVYFFYLLHFSHPLFCFYNFHYYQSVDKTLSYESPLLASGSFKRIVSCQGSMVNLDPSEEFQNGRWFWNFLLQQTSFCLHFG